MTRRALLTDGERDALIHPEERENPYVTVSRVRKKIQEELPRDVEILQEHHPGLLEELREVVCKDQEAADVEEGDRDAGGGPEAEEDVVEGDRTDQEAKEEAYEDLDEGPDSNGGDEE